MLLFVVCVVVVLVVSATCSVTEAALYAVRMPYIRQLAETGSRSGHVLSAFKENMERPIAAILILNTAANTAGASIAGAQARLLFGDAALVWFSALFTVTVLVGAEIIPKVVGVAYQRPISVWMARPLNYVILGLTPLVWSVEQLTRWLMPREKPQSFPEEEVQQMAVISAEEGSILPVEAKLVANVLRLNDVTAAEIMTPLSQVLSLPADWTLRKVAGQVKEWRHSRVPIHDDSGELVGVVLSRSVLTELAQDHFDNTLQSLAGPLPCVSSTMPGHLLLMMFLRQKRHLFAVLDEANHCVGIVTLEDVLESLLGAEIYDEADTASRFMPTSPPRR